MISVSFGFNNYRRIIYFIVDMTQPLFANYEIIWIRSIAMILFLATKGEED